MNVTNFVQNPGGPNARRYPLESIEAAYCAIELVRADGKRTMLRGHLGDFVGLAHTCFRVLMKQPAGDLAKSLPALRELRAEIDRAIRMGEAIESPSS